jgi:hypothetical protein
MEPGRDLPFRIQPGVARRGYAGSPGLSGVSYESFLCESLSKFVEYDRGEA